MMTAKRPIWLAVLAAFLLLVAAACGDDDDDTSASADDGTADVSDDGSEDAGDDAGADDGDDGGEGDDGASTGGSGEFGTIIINGDEYGVDTLNRCIPFSESDEDLDLQALGGGVKINIYATAGTVDDVSVDGSTVSNEYGSIAFGGSDSDISDATVDGGRTTGSATLPDATGSGETVDVQWDVEIPDEVRDCSL